MAFITTESVPFRLLLTLTFTGEPWHYRYVGKKAASAMYAQDLCLEEYVQGLSD